MEPSPGRERPKRISIVGATGSGKTYLARALADQLHLPLYELDTFRRDSHGCELPRQEFVDRIAEVAAQDEWIIDGHYRDVRHLIWRRAQTVVWLNYSLAFVMLRLLRRFSGKTAASRAVRTTSVQEGAGGMRSASHPTASWSQRLRRLTRTFRERREYAFLLRAPEYRGLCVVELKTVRQTRDWLRRQPVSSRA